MMIHPQTLEAPGTKFGSKFPMTCPKRPHSGIPWFWIPSNCRYIGLKLHKWPSGHQDGWLVNPNQKWQMGKHPTKLKNPANHVSYV